MRYGFQLMNFSRWIKLMDAAIAYIQLRHEREKILEQQIEAKDQEIAAKNRLIGSLQEHLATASTALFANESELQQLDDKFRHLSSMVLPEEGD